MAIDIVNKLPRRQPAEGTQTIVFHRQIEGRPLADRVQPKPGQQRITNTGQLLAVALSPGMKVIICQDAAAVNYVALCVFLTLCQSVDGKVNLGWATGSTTEGLRFALPMPEFTRQHLGLALDPGTIKCLSTMDDYFFSPQGYQRTESICGREVEAINAGRLPFTYRREQLTIATRFDGFSPKQLIAAPLCWQDGTVAANYWEQNCLPQARPALIQLGSIGMSNHYAFNEAGSPLLFMPTREEILCFGTRAQNAFAFTQRGEPLLNPVFRELIAEFGVSNEQELRRTLTDLSRKYQERNVFPPELERCDEQALIALLTQPEANLQRLLDYIVRVPSCAITQGTGPLTDPAITLFALNMIVGYHKAKAVKGTLEGSLDGGRLSDYPMRAVLTTANSLWLLDQRAARDLEVEGGRYFLFEPPNSSWVSETFATDTIASQFWQTYPAEVKSRLIAHIEEENRRLLS